MPRLFYLLPTEIETPKTCVLFVIVHSVQAMLGAEKNIGLRDRASGERYCKQERAGWRCEEFNQRRRHAAGNWIWKLENLSAATEFGTQREQLLLWMINANFQSKNFGISSLAPTGPASGYFPAHNSRVGERGQCKLGLGVLRCLFNARVLSIHVSVTL